MTVPLAAPAPVLDVRGLTVELPRGGERRHAVEAVDLAVRPGETLCLVGESGSGKSVTGFSIVGLLPPGELRPVAGSIRLDGEELLGAAPARLRRLRGAKMAMIFQEPMTALNPMMPCGRQIDELLGAHTSLGSGARRERTLAALAEVGLPDPARIYASYPHELSGGQRQRIMIAMAVILEPMLLVADEPTTALDVTTQAQILRLLKGLQSRHGAAVLFITHDFGVVSEIADRVAVMQGGRVVETGERDAVLRRPGHAYTRMLLAAVPGLTPVARARRPSSRPVLRVDGLGKTYRGDFLRPRTPMPAAREVSLAVRRGETLGIVGESGSGKSTVARCIARLIEPTAGTIELDGRDIARLGRRQLHPFRRRVQLVFQDPYRSLNPRRTVGQALVEGPLNFGRDHADAWARARELMALVQLDPDALDRYPHQFSGGQRQRICVARALALEPDLLIADEAVSALDVSVQARVLALLAEIQARLDLAMLFITHDLRVAAQVCDRVAVMRGGTIVEHGEIGEVFGRSRHPYTKELLEAAPGRGFVFGEHAAGA